MNSKSMKDILSSSEFNALPEDMRKRIGAMQDTLKAVSTLRSDLKHLKPRRDTSPMVEQTLALVEKCSDLRLTSSRGGTVIPKACHGRHCVPTGYVTFEYQKDGEKKSGDLAHCVLPEHIRDDLAMLTSHESPSDIRDNLLTAYRGLEEQAKARSRASCEVLRTRGECLSASRNIPCTFEKQRDQTTIMVNSRDEAQFMAPGEDDAVPSPSDLGRCRTLGKVGKIVDPDKPNDPVAAVVGQLLRYHTAKVLDDTCDRMFTEGSVVGECVATYDRKRERQGGCGVFDNAKGRFLTLEEAQERRHDPVTNEVCKSKAAENISWRVAGDRDNQPFLENINDEEFLRAVGEGLTSAQRDEISRLHHLLRVPGTAHRLLMEIAVLIDQLDMVVRRREMFGVGTQRNLGGVEDIGGGVERAMDIEEIQDTIEKRLIDLEENSDTITHNVVDWVGSLLSEPARLLFYRTVNYLLEDDDTLLEEDTIFQGGGGWLSDLNDLNAEIRGESTQTNWRDSLQSLIGELKGGDFAGGRILPTETAVMQQAKLPAPETEMSLLELPHTSQLSEVLGGGAMAKLPDPEGEVSLLVLPEIEEI